MAIDKPVTLKPYHRYLLRLNGKHYPHVSAEVRDGFTNELLYRPYTLAGLFLRVEAGEVLAGHTVAIEVRNIGSVHVERAVNGGYILPVYNRAERRFEMHLYSEGTPGYTLLATS